MFGLRLIYGFSNIVLELKSDSSQSEGATNNLLQICAGCTPSIRFYYCIADVRAEKILQTSARGFLSSFLKRKKKLLHRTAAHLSEVTINNPLLSPGRQLETHKVHKRRIKGDPSQHSPGSSSAAELAQPI